MAEQKPFQEDQDPKQNKNQLLDYLPAILMLFVLSAVFGILLITPNQGVNNEDVLDDGNDFALDAGQLVAQIPDSDDSFEYRGGTITIPTGWYIDIVLLSDQNSLYDCLGNSCTIYVIRSLDETSVLNKLVISTPNPVKLVASVADDRSGLDEVPSYILGFLGEQIEMEYNSYFEPTIVDGELDFNNVVPSYPLELFGCTNDQLCIHVGPLDGEPDVNAAQLDVLRAILPQFSR